ncbi:MAG TPA: arginase family protein, partial [Actinomycetes bacterium]|nr:arginase family protein [Actinomycetes bacterium]
MPRPITVLDAPSNLGLRPPRPGAEPGVRHLAAALRELDLVGRLGARDAGRIEVPAYSPEPEPTTGFRNGPAIRTVTTTLAAELGALLDRGSFPFVLGGDCSIVLGAMLALRRRGRYGLAFIDGHDDYSWVKDYDGYVGRFAAAGLDLGLVTGHGPDALCDIDGLGPYVRETDVVHLGLQREPEDSEFFDVARFDQSPITRYTAEEIRSRGASPVAELARDYLEAVRAAPGFWIHLDADVLHTDVMPAVDSPNPNGISLAELETILGTLLASPRAVGMHVGIYDPE